MQGECRGKVDACAGEECLVWWWVQYSGGVCG